MTTMESALLEIRNHLGVSGYDRHNWFVADSALAGSGKSKYPAEFYKSSQFEVYMSSHESSSAQSNHQMHAVQALKTILKLARDGYAMNQDDATFVEIINIAQKAIAENE